jgi:hypothetical protein
VSARPLSALVAAQGKGAARHRWRVLSVQVDTCQRCGLRRKRQDGAWWYRPARQRGAWTWGETVPVCPGEPVPTARRWCRP